MRQPGEFSVPTPQWGTFCLTGCAPMVEAMGHLGFDFVVIDCEHGEVSPYGPELVTLVRACVAGGASPFVRVATNDPGQILRALDAGAEAVIVPQVSTRAQAESIVEYGRYPPHGRRSACPSVRSARYGATDWSTVYRADSVGSRLIPLIEDVAAVGEVEHIAAVPGLGGLFFGPFDLAMSQGSVDGTIVGGPDLRQRVYSAARTNGLPVADPLSVKVELDTP